jgi:hypothetical protein
MRVLPLYARHALRPRRNLPILAYRIRHYCLLRLETHRLPLSTITGLNRFTLSHCGSHTPMPTLKPHLAASAPRLGTDCLLRFVRSGLSPDYITHTELAHSTPCQSNVRSFYAAPSPYCLGYCTRSSVILPRILLSVSCNFTQREARRAPVAYQYLSDRQNFLMLSDKSKALWLSRTFLIEPPIKKTSLLIIYIHNFTLRF